MTRVYEDGPSGHVRRHHLHEAVVQRAFREGLQHALRCGAWASGATRRTRRIFRLGRSSNKRGYDYLCALASGVAACLVV